jgi:uncharacterized protein (DUF2237 family)
MLGYNRHMTSSQRNLLGLPLEPCSTRPMTGFFRTGCCAFSARRGNDLSTPRPGFAGLRPGDHWCLCAERWKEALDADVAPPVILASTHESATTIVDRTALLAHAVDSHTLN